MEEPQQFEMKSCPERVGFPCDDLFLTIIVEHYICILNLLYQFVGCGDCAVHLSPNIGKSTLSFNLLVIEFAVCFCRPIYGYEILTHELQHTNRKVFAI